ncbi:toxin-antitoxin system HicB family antitoxin [Streptomyces sp. S465]|uniref:toxin-antitoxin system HicB family antitoxin n=1 Tax=Streptomyces sp. S465 TaxID=2979468 RepID=UPI003FCC39CA
MTDEKESGRKPRQPRQRKQMLLRLDPAVHDALARWADDELRSANAQIEFLLRKALAEAGRLPRAARPIPRRGRPPRRPAEGAEGADGAEGAGGVEDTDGTAGTERAPD